MYTCKNKLAYTMVLKVKYYGIPVYFQEYRSWYTKVLVQNQCTCNKNMSKKYFDNVHIKLITKIMYINNVFALMF